MKARGERREGEEEGDHGRGTNGGEDSLAAMLLGDEQLARLGQKSMALSALPVAT